ncbi:hypothetical protein HII36_32195 [Nonomuraea sp. NN258]|uniref:hypothetical protein n=1 Tax=Nonomuraea antri TaxID=2730852 RepID=UPI00156966CB|nr:hypothetical protein [Nonomuraea antri]NRQ36460.1 hypothetical protein [Nonomuraea antri]
MRHKWVFLLAGLAVCVLATAVPFIGSPFVYMARETPIDPVGPAARRLVEDTFYLTQGIEVGQSLLPVEKGVTFRPAYVAVGVKVDGGGRLHGAPTRTGTFVAPVALCQGQSCQEEQVTLVVLSNVPWEPRDLTFPGKSGTALTGHIAISGGPAGVVPTYTVTDPAKLPRGVAIGPDGRVGGVPAAPGVSEVPVRICVAGNCAGVVVRLIIV